MWFHVGKQEIVEAISFTAHETLILQMIVLIYKKTLSFRFSDELLILGKFYWQNLQQLIQEN